MALEEQADEDFEMVQLGLAVAIINHEFAASISSVRKSVQQLGQISRRSDGLRPLYDSIRTNFEHLDGHLNLFTPLQRRLQRSKIKIDGAFRKPPRTTRRRVPSHGSPARNDGRVLSLDALPRDHQHR